MSGNQFIVYSHWEARPESPARLGERMLRSLDALSEISPLFQPWWLIDHSYSIEELMDMEDDERPQLGFPLDDVRAGMTEIVELGVDKADDGEATPETGYAISASNSPTTSPRTVGLSAHGADSTQGRARREASFQTAYGEIPDPRIVAYPVFKAALLTLVRDWNVDYAEAYSSDLMNMWRHVPWRRHFELAWMTYLSAPLAKQITPPLDVKVERTPDGGLLMIAAEETFDVANPKHMGAARRIVHALAPFNEAQDDEDRPKLKKDPNWLVGKLLNHVALTKADKSCLDETPAEYKVLMKGVIKRLLFNNPDDASLADAWDGTMGGRSSNVDLRESLEMFLSWLS